jgi:hypothetical protein
LIHVVYVYMKCMCERESLLPEMKLTIGSSRLDTLRLRSRPAFMERDMVVPSWEVWDGEQARERMLRLRRSTFPLKDDAGYIGYLSDDEDEAGPAGRSSGGGSIQTTKNTPTYDGGGGWGVGDGGVDGGGGGGADDLISIRRRELMGSDISFTETLTIMVIAGFIMLFILAASPWGIIPPRDGGGFRP